MPVLQNGLYIKSRNRCDNTEITLTMSDEELDISIPCDGQEEKVILRDYLGMSIFQMTSSLKYFNAETILQEELNNGFENYLKNNGSIILAIQKIFQQKCQSPRVMSLNSEEKTGKIENSLKKKRSLSTKQIDLAKRIHYGLSPPDSDLDSSISVLLSSTALEDSPEKSLLNFSSVDACKSEQNEYNEDIKKEEVDLSSLFLLMSILPDEDANFCKQTLDKDLFAWKIEIVHVLLIFLNWGATLKSMELEEVVDPSFIEDFSPLQASQCNSEFTVNSSVPNPMNVKLVLSTICERLPTDSEMSLRKKALLIRMIVFLALDNQQRQNQSIFCTTVRSILSSISDWDLEKANIIVNNLGLKNLDPRNSAFVCSCVFSLVDERLSQVGLLACYNVLHHQFGFSADVLLFSTFIDQLTSPPELFDRFKFWELFVLTQLIHTLLLKHSLSASSCPQEAVQRLYHWIDEVHSALKKPPYMDNLHSGLLRERLTRVLVECISVRHKLYGYSKHRTYDSDLVDDMEDCPSK